MKDAEVREDLKKLCATVVGLQAQLNSRNQAISEAVIAHFKPRFDESQQLFHQRVNDLQDSAAGFMALADLVEQLRAGINSVHAELERIDTDNNAIRVDMAALLETQAELADEIGQVMGFLQNFASNVPGRPRPGNVTAKRQEHKG